MTSQQNQIRHTATLYEKKIFAYISALHSLPDEKFEGRKQNHMRRDN